MQSKKKIVCALLVLACIAAFVLGLLAKLGAGMEKQPAEYCNICFILAAAALLTLICSVGGGKREGTEKTRPITFFFSGFLLSKRAAQRVAYVGVTVALCIVSNMFEVKSITTQFSFTVFSSILAGIVLGALPGFCAAFLGDALGFLVNSMGTVYYWWVALAVALMAAIAGLVMHIPVSGKKGIYVKLALISVLTFFVCSLGVNTTGTYYIGLSIYLPSNVTQAVEDVFGGKLTFWIYCVIRFFLLGQIWNSLINYAMLFAVVPPLLRMKPFAEAGNEKSASERVSG